MPRNQQTYRLQSSAVWSYLCNLYGLLYIVSPMVSCCMVSPMVSCCMVLPMVSCCMVSLMVFCCMVSPMVSCCILTSRLQSLTGSSSRLMSSTSTCTHGGGGHFSQQSPHRQVAPRKNCAWQLLFVLFKLIQNTGGNLHVF